MTYPGTNTKETWRDIFAQEAANGNPLAKVLLGHEEENTEHDLIDEEIIKQIPREKMGYLSKDKSEKLRKAKEKKMMKRAKK